MLSLLVGLIAVKIGIIGSLAPLLRPQQVRIIHYPF